MEWFVFAAPVPGPVEVGTLGWFSFLAQAVALAPLWLVARRAVGFRAHEPAKGSQLRVIEGGRELSPHAV
jgi:hypothetical protein